MKSLLIAAVLLFAACGENTVEATGTPNASRTKSELKVFLKSRYYRDPAAPKICWKYAFVCRECGTNVAHGGPLAGAVPCDLLPPESIVDAEALP